MKRALVALAAVLFIAAAKDRHACDGRNAVVIELDGMTVANGIGGTDMKKLIDTYGHRFAYFSRDGRHYLIRDQETIDRLEALYTPQVRLGRQQASLGTKQAALGTQQASIGFEQARIGMEQARIRDSSSARYQELVRRQNELAGQQNKLAEEQNRLGAQQSAMGKKQDELSRDADRGAGPIFDQAIRSGIAIEVR